MSFCSTSFNTRIAIRSRPLMFCNELKFQDRRHRQRNYLMRDRLSPSRWYIDAYCSTTVDNCINVELLRACVLPRMPITCIALRSVTLERDSTRKSDNKGGHRRLTSTMTTPSDGMRLDGKRLSNHPGHSKILRRRFVGSSGSDISTWDSPTPREEIADRRAEEMSFWDKSGP